MSPIIVDTSAIVALFDEHYDEHESLVRLLVEGTEPLVVSPFVVAEADYMLHTRLGADTARRFASDIVTGAYDLAEWTAEDHASALNIANAYGEGKDYVGIADAGNVVIADHYRTTTVATLDQRHFRVMRPLWGAKHFTLLPYDS